MAEEVVLDEDGPGTAFRDGKGGVAGGGGGSDVLLSAGGEIGLQTAEGTAGTEHGKEVAAVAEGADFGRLEGVERVQQELLGACLAARRLRQPVERVAYFSEIERVGFHCFAFSNGKQKYKIVGSKQTENVYLCDLEKLNNKLSL